MRREKDQRKSPCCNIPFENPDRNPSSPCPLYTTPLPFSRLLQKKTTAASMIGSRGSVLVFLLSCFLLSCDLIPLLPALPKAFPSRQSKPAPQSGRCLLRSCCFDCAQTVNSYYTILVGFRFLPELFHIRSNELRSAFAEDTEHFRRFHPDFIVCIVQQLGKNRHRICVDVRCVRGNVFRCPDKAQPHLRFFVGSQAKQPGPIRCNHRKAASSDSAERGRSTSPQKRISALTERGNHRNGICCCLWIYETHFTKKPQRFRLYFYGVRHKQG